MLPNISQSKGNQTNKFGQLIEHNLRIICLQNLCGIRGRVNSSKPFFFFLKETLYEFKTSGLQLSFNIFRQPSTCHTIKRKRIKLQTINPEICSIFNFQKRVWDQFLQHILCMIFQEKCFSYYILLPNQILYLIAFTSRDMGQDVY